MKLLKLLIDPKAKRIQKSYNRLLDDYRIQQEIIREQKYEILRLKEKVDKGVK